MPKLRAMNMVWMPRNLVQDASCLDLPFEHRLVRAALQSFDASLGPMFRVVICLWVMQDSRYQTTSYVRRRKLNWCFENYRSRFLGHYWHVYDFWSSFVILYSLCQLSSTIQGWPSPALVERTTLQLQIWCHCHCRRNLVLRFYFFTAYDIVWIYTLRATLNPPWCCLQTGIFMF